MKWFFPVLILITMSASAQKTLPEAELKTLNGKKVSLADYVEEGKVTILNFWATWCAPCKKELDALAPVYPSWEEKYGVKFLAITVDDSRGFPKVKPMVREKDWPYTILSDINQDMMRKLNFYSIPQMYVVDGQGEIKHTITGYIPGSEKDLESKIAALTEE